MTYQHLHFDIDGRLATVRLARPEARNALSQALMRELLAVAREVAAQTLALPATAVRMSKETVNAVATVLYHASSHMGHDQIALAAASVESRAAREAALKSRAFRMSTPRTSTTALIGTAFATLLLIALMMGANHVAARLAFNHGVDVVTAVTFRSGVTAAAVTLLVLVYRVPLRLSARHRRALPAIGLLVAVQSLCLYASVAWLPVALALLAFNTYPLWTALWARVVYQHRPEPRVLRAMPVMLLGLALVFTQHEAADLDGRLRTATTMALVGLMAAAAMAWQGGPEAA